MRNKKGFTLIETVVALGILTTALAGALILIFAAMNLSMNSRNSTTANAYMQKRMADSISVFCVGCGMTPDDATLQRALGTSSDISDLRDDGTRGTGGHVAKQYQPGATSIDGVSYEGTVYIDRDFTAIPPTDEHQITKDKFAKIISVVKWTYRGQDYNVKTSEYVRLYR